MKKSLWEVCLGVSGQEMFSNSTVALGHRGLPALDYVNNLIEIRRVG